MTSLFKRSFTLLVAAATSTAYAQFEEVVPVEIGDPNVSFAEANWSETPKIATASSSAAGSTPAPQAAQTPAPADGPDTASLPPDPLNELDAQMQPLVSEPAPPQPNVAIILINKLVQKGVLEKEEADLMIRQAQEEAAAMQAQLAATQEAVAAQGAAIVETAEIAQAAAEAATPPAPEDGEVRVAYVPEVVRDKIKDDLKHEVLAHAESEGWVAPNRIPGWVDRIRPYADLRFRYEGDFFPGGNDATGAFPNFNAINTGAPFNVAGNEFSSQLNVDQDRNRFRLRARLGVEADLGDHFTAGARIATGQDNSPVSTNQSIGLPYQGQGGNFSKYAIWLDRAYLQWQLTGDPKKDVGLLVGRFDNPFFSTTSIVWDDDLGFDGIALQAAYEVVSGVTPFLAAGAFPVYNTDFNFSSNQPAKFKSYDKYLFGIQGGLDVTAVKDFNLRTGLAYYYFLNTEGKLSSPYVPMSPNDAGDTDASRPAFAQKGNTYMALRDIIPTEANDYGTINQWQYYGLATKFQNIVFSGRLDYTRFEPFAISLMGEFAQNIAFNAGEINKVAVNNRGPLDDDLSDSTNFGDFVGSNSAWAIQLQVGSLALDRPWAWNVGFGYRYVGSDAVIDGFTESDFAGGGTNIKGYIIGANLALSKNVWIGTRWMSAESVAGPQFKEDIFQLDLNARF
jgi:Uncharacterized protein conserved in bacteria